ncbi:MAG: HlyD family efflux transporter periplasmic adaptor subunit [Parvularculaceae bacterium]|nr:HlyD family efflux transporter periplasmic adaptor subunit [Parvularculaceae bacterium]
MSHRCVTPDHARRGAFSGIEKGIAAALFALFLVACAPEDEKTLAGYVEADLLYLAPQDAGVVKSLSVREGDRVNAGDILFALDPDRLSLAADQTKATALGVAARAADEGAMTKQIAEAEAALKLAEKTFRRSSELVKDGAVTKEKFDIDATALASTKAQLERLRAERDAMLREWDGATAAARLAERRLADLEMTAPAAGSIERIYRRPGEVVAAGDPVVALLAPENIKIKFFAPEPMLSSLKSGATISFTCDGCDGAMTAKISFIASKPQYTPPVIYSIKEREKLVFLVEARPDNQDALRPGLPVKVLAP